MTCATWYFSTEKAIALYKCGCSVRGIDATWESNQIPLHCILDQPSLILVSYFRPSSALIYDPSVIHQPTICHTAMQIQSWVIHKFSLRLISAIHLPPFVIHLSSTCNPHDILVSYIYFPFIWKHLSSIYCSCVIKVAFIWEHLSSNFNPPAIHMLPLRHTYTYIFHRSSIICPSAALHFLSMTCFSIFVIHLPSTCHH